MSKLKIAIFLSGRGSNFEAILKNIHNNNVDATIECVVSNNPNAVGLNLAKTHNIPTYTYSPKEFKNTEEYEKTILSDLKSHPIDLIVCAGYMKLIGHTLLDAYPNKIINIHPSLLPSFKGLHAQKQALEYGVKLSGCTVHFVDSSLDGGAIIRQVSVDVKEDDTEETLSERILKQEHIVYSNVIQLFAKGNITIKNRNIIIN